MTVLESIPEKLGITGQWIEKGGVHWLATGALNVRDLAATMNAVHARFVTITAYQLPGQEGFRLEYHLGPRRPVAGISVSAPRQFHRIASTTFARPWTGLSAKFTKASPSIFWGASMNRCFCARETSRE